VVVKIRLCMCTGDDSRIVNMVQVSTSRETAKNFALLLFSNKCIENWKSNQGYKVPHLKKIFKLIIRLLDL